MSSPLLSEAFPDRSGWTPPRLIAVRRDNASPVRDAGLVAFCLVAVEVFINSTKRDAMHLNIKSDEVHRLATELSRLTGESLTSAVKAALRERLDREQRRRRRKGVAQRLMAIGQRYASLPDGTRTDPDAIIGYDETGVPR